MFTARKQRLFLDLLRQQAGLLLQAAQALGRFLSDRSSSTTAEIAAYSTQSEALLAQTINALTDTFVTPFDRQDIYNLAQAMDDMIDYFDSAAREVELFKVDATPQMVEMVNLLAEASADINTAIENIETRASVAVQCATKACGVENAVEDVYRRTLAELFDTPDVHRIFKLREIYRHLSNGADRADAIGKLIGKIVVKVA